MNTFPNLKKTANELRKDQDYVASLEIYKNLWTKHRSFCGVWEVWGYAYCLRKTGDVEKSLDICRHLYGLDSTFDLGKNLYAWCIYDLEIKKKQDEIENDEARFLKAANAINDLVKQDGYSPYTRTILKVVSYLNSKTKPDYNIIIKWLHKLKPGDLSKEAIKYSDDKGYEKELMPDLEKWYFFITKSLFMTGQYEQCIELSKEALNHLSRFSMNNDIWIKRRIALSLDKIGDVDSAIRILSEVIKEKQDWFIYYELSDLYYRQNQANNALKYAIESALGHGKIENKWKLYLHLGNILKAKGDDLFSDLHFKLVDIIKNEQGWNSIPEMENSKINSDVKANNNKGLTMKKLRAFWEKQKFAELDKDEGKISNILSHGKSGFIKSNKGIDLFFRKKNFSGNKKLLLKGQKVSFYIVESFDNKKNKKSIEAINIKEL